MDKIGEKNYRDDLERLTHNRRQAEHRLQDSLDFWNTKDRSRLCRRKILLMQKQYEDADVAKRKREDQSNYRLVAPVLKDKLKGLVAPDHQVGKNISKYLDASGGRRKTKKRRRKKKDRKRRTKKRRKRRTKKTRKRS